MKKSIKKLLISTAAIASLAGVGLGVAYGVNSSINSNSNDVEQNVITPGKYTNAASFYNAVGLENGTPFQLRDREQNNGAYSYGAYIDTTFSPYVDGANDRKSIELVDSYDIGNGIVAVESPATGTAISLKLDNPYVGMETAEGVGGNDDVKQYEETFLTVDYWNNSSSTGSGVVWAPQPPAGDNSCDVILEVKEDFEEPGTALVSIEFVKYEQSNKTVWGGLYNSSSILTMGTGVYFFKLVPLPTTTSDPLNQAGADIIVPYTLEHFNIATGNTSGSPFSIWDGNKRLGYFTNAAGAYDDPTKMAWINPVDEQLPNSLYYTSIFELKQTKTGWNTAGLFTLQWVNPNDPNDFIQVYDETALSDDIRPGKALDWGKYNFKTQGDVERGYAYRVYIDVTTPETKVYLYNPFTGKYLGDWSEAKANSDKIEGTTDSYHAMTTEVPKSFELRIPNQDMPAFIGGGLYQDEPTAKYDAANNTLELTYYIYLNTWGVDINSDGNPLDDTDGDGIIDEGWIEIWINPKGTTDPADYTKKVLDTATLENQEILINGKGTTTFLIENLPPLDASNTTGLPTVKLYIPETGQSKEVTVTLI